ncbi:MAG: MlaD family protein [Geminicoccaceae bacterium]
MSSKASPRVIGAFVLGGMALLAVGIVVFGGAQWFQHRTSVVSFFPGSIAGLRVGASVNFRGVSVGQVTDIKVLFDQESVQARIPVVFDMDPNRIIEVGKGESVDNAAFRQNLIQKGLRAQLGLESVVTGLLSVNLDFFPNAGPPEFHNSGEFALPYPEVPTMQSDLQALQANAGEIAKELTAALNSMNELLSGFSAAADATKGRIDNIINSVAEIAKDMSTIAPKVADLVDESTRSAAAVTRTLDSANTLMQDNAAGISQSVADLQTSLVAFRRMADQVNNMVAENRDGLRDFTRTGLYEITGLAQDAERMVDQITRVMEDLERDPARFLFGNRSRGVQAE